MTFYAIVVNNRVENVVVSDNKEVVEQIHSGTVLETTGEPWNGWIFEDGIWKEPKPYDSWVWVDNQWFPPVELPEDPENYIWDENSQNWTPLN